MEQKVLAELRERLLAERANVAVHYSQHTPVPHGNEPGSDILDEADQVTASHEDATQDALAHSELLLLEKIDLALKRIADGSYGFCLACSDEIPTERMLAKPSVSLCLSCQEEKEKSKSETFRRTL